MIDFDALALAPIRDAFGESVTIRRRADAVSATVLGVFQQAYMAEVIGADGPEHVTMDPNVGVRVADVGWVPVQGDTLTRAADGARYLVTKHQLDGLGWVKLQLRLVT